MKKLLVCLLALMLPLCAALASALPDDGHAHYAACNAPGVCVECGYVDASLEGCHDFGYAIWFDFHVSMCRFCGIENSEREAHVNATIAYENESVHILSCDICGTGRFDHESNCLNPEKCIYCGGAYSGGSTNHIYANFTYDADENNHWLVCDVCGEAGEWPAETHSSDGSRPNDATGHWKICKICSESYGHAAHAANCETSGICAACGYEDASLEPQHVPVLTGSTAAHWTMCQYCFEPMSDEEPHVNSVLSYENERFHHFSCDVCGGVSAWHENDCLHTDTCYICGSAYIGTNPIFHSYQEGKYGSDESGHWNKCDLCGAPHESGVSEHWHDGSMHSDATGHWNECGNCGYQMNFASHAANCETAGICAICGYEDASLEPQHLPAYGGSAYEHWLVCQHCYEPQSEPEAHVNPVYAYDDELFHSITCSVCGVHWMEHRNDCQHPDTCALCGGAYSGGSADHVAEKWEFGWDEDSHWIKCDACGGLYDPDGDIPHWSEAGWESDATGHWYICGDCGQKFGFEAHKAACTEPGVCVNCGHQDAALEGQHESGYAQSLSAHRFACIWCGEAHSEPEAHVNLIIEYKTQKVHKLTCDICGNFWMSHRGTCLNPNTCIDCGGSFTEGDIADHVYDQGVFEGNAEYHWPICDVCGQPDLSLTEGHTSDGVWSGDGEYHWVECWDCGERYNLDLHASYGALCPDVTVCRHCGLDTGAELEVEHNVVFDAYKYDAEKHWNYCSTCDWTTGETAHTFVNGVCSNEKCRYEHDHAWVAGTSTATCTEAGIIPYTCEGCDATKSEEAPSLGHTEETVPGKAASCTETGLTDGKKCSVCGTVTVEQTVIATLGHDEETVAKQDPTCNEKGMITTECKNCGETRTEEYGNATGHNWGAPETVEATCTEKGSKKVTCTVCGVFTRSYTNALGHSFGEYVSQNDGTHATTCENGCGEKQTASCNLVTDETGALHCSVCSYMIPAPTPKPTEKPTAAPTQEPTPEPAVSETSAATPAPTPAPTPKPIIGKTEEAKIEFVAAKNTEKPLQTVQLIVTVHQPAAEPETLLPTTNEITETPAPEASEAPEAQPPVPAAENPVVSAFRAENPQAQILSVTLLVDEKETEELTNKVRISIPVATDTAEDFRLVFLDKNGNVIEVEYEIIDGQIVFETEFLGLFALVPAEN